MNCRVVGKNIIGGPTVKAAAGGEQRRVCIESPCVYLLCHIHPERDINSEWARGRVIEIRQRRGDRGTTCRRQSKEPVVTPLKGGARLNDVFVGNYYAILGQIRGSGEKIWVHPAGVVGQSNRGTAPAFEIASDFHGLGIGINTGRAHVHLKIDDGVGACCQRSAHQHSAKREEGFAVHIGVSKFVDSYLRLLWADNTQFTAPEATAYLCGWRLFFNRGGTLRRLQSWNARAAFHKPCARSCERYRC